MDLVGGERVLVPLRASDKPDELGQPDLIVLAVKGPALASVAPAVKALLGPQTRVLVAMNGVPWWFFQGLAGEAEGLQRGIGGPRRRGGRPDPGGARDRLRGARQLHPPPPPPTPEPGLVRHVMGMGLILGDPAGGQPAHLSELAALLGRAGFKVTVSGAHPARHLVQALGQYDHEPDLGPDRRHLRPHPR